MSPKRLVRRALKEANSSLVRNLGKPRGTELQQVFLGADGALQRVAADGDSVYHARAGGKRQMAVNSNGLPNSFSPDALVTVNASEVVIDNHLHSTAIAVHSRDPLIWGSIIGIVLVALILSLLVFYFHRKKCSADTNNACNPKARSALMSHQRGGSRPSWEIFFDLIQYTPSPYNKKWCELMRDEGVANQIDAAFDALQGVEAFRKRDAVKLLNSLEWEWGMRDDGEDAYRLQESIETSEDDLEWLLKDWDEIFPGEVDRSSFHDLFKLLITWMRVRHIKYHLMIGDVVPGYLPAIYHSLRVVIGSDYEPIAILRYEFPAAYAGQIGVQTGFAREAQEREFVPGKDEHSKKQRYRRGSRAALPSKSIEQQADDSDHAIRGRSRSNGRSASQSRSRASSADEWRRWYPESARARSQSLGPEGRSRDDGAER